MRAAEASSPSPSRPRGILGLHQLAIVGLAEERESVTGEKTVDRVYLPGQKNGILLRPGSSALFCRPRDHPPAPRRAPEGDRRARRSERRLDGLIPRLPAFC